MVEDRVRDYKRDEAKPTDVIQDCFNKFSSLTPDTEWYSQYEKVEGGFVCSEKTYFYDTSEFTEGSVIASRTFKVSGVDGRPITQFLQVDLGSEFLYSANLAILIRQAGGIPTEQHKGSQLECLLDNSC